VDRDVPALTTYPTTSYGTTGQHPWFRADEPSYLREHQDGILRRLLGLAGCWKFSLRVFDHARRPETVQLWVEPRCQDES
jgi:hypothetical protein